MFTIPTHFRSTATGKQMSRTIFTRAQKHGYTSEGVQSYVYKYQVQSSVALYRYWQPIIQDHFTPPTGGRLEHTLMEMLADMAAYVRV